MDTNEIVNIKKKIKNHILDNKKIIIIFIIIFSVLLLLISNKNIIYGLLNYLKLFKNHKISIYIYIIITYIISLLLHQLGFINIITGYIYGFNPGYYIALFVNFFALLSSFLISKNIHKNNLKNVDHLNKLKKKFYIFGLKFLSTHGTAYYWGSTNIKTINYIIPMFLQLIIKVFIEIYIGSYLKNIKNIKHYIDVSTGFLRNYSKYILLFFIIIIILLYILGNKYSNHLELEQNDEKKLEN